ncbi:GCN5 family acetyltransferase [Rhizobium sp. Root274]|uniref:GNAT family N-acetyltransferase n=1 Tax=unclassified Rhizobium TaxID=2613769 RepID=UPI00071356C8|nr:MULTISPECIES: GNAT family N-acetyltransferase [unclassified Rhizobium]KQW32042.1 GCN5 family acetyltransferase [Rhizobium sp. Root1240]KRD33579.1 GCN5 family acetyltransferase [Rhizobium sp. Root274]
MPDIRQLSANEALEHIPALTEVLADCIADNASVGFMPPFTAQEGDAFWRGVAEAVGRGEVLLYGAFVEDRLVGTVQIGFALKPNQPHRADLMKLLVHRAARGNGLSTALMTAAEAGAAQAGRKLLVLDTAKGELAERIYEKLGWQRSGEIPDYALYPDGRFCDTVIFYKRLG